MGRSRVMKIGTVLAAVVAMLLGAGALAGGPAEAQAGREGGAFSYPPPPPPPDYAYRNGEVYVDGDEVLDCRTFAESFDEGYDEFGDQAQAERVLERSERAGLPSGDVPPEVRAEIRAYLRAEALPETGGLAPAAPLLIAGVSLVAGCLLASRVR